MNVFLPDEKGLLSKISFRYGMGKSAILAVTNDLVTDQRVSKIAETLTENGFSVQLIGRLLPDSKPLLDKPYRTQRMKLLFRKGFAFYAEYNIRLFLKLLMAKADVFTANDLDTLPAVWCAAKLRAKPVVYDSHEYFTEVPELLENKVAKNVWTRAERFILPKLSFAMTVCQSIAQVYSEKYGVSFSVVRNVPHFNDYPPTLSSARDQKTIIYQGAVNLGRGLELMINAMPMIESANLLIIGGGDKLAELKEKVEKMNLSDRVHFTGKLNYEALRSYTLQADIGISLEENMGLNYYYALPNKLFDYIQCRVPVLASDLPEIRRIVDTYAVGKILEDRTPEALAAAVHKMLTDADQRYYWKANAQIAAKELCWEHEKQTLISLYTKATS